MKAPILPLISINGTSPQELCEAYHNAASFVHDAIRAICHAGPHPRDYQAGNLAECFARAAEQHLARVNALRDVMQELEALAEHCAKAQADREARRRERDEAYRKHAEQEEAERLSREEADAAGQLDDSDDDTAAENTGNSMKLEAIP